jgi:two-component system, cell cycle response regulator DivK
MVSPFPPRSVPVVLVVEDTEDEYELLSDILADADLDVVGAENGIDAVDTAVKLLPDLILMDLSLPLMGGCEATRLLKSDERTRNIPIIAVTAHYNYAEIARQAGCDAFLTKPCPPERLLEEITRILGPLPKLGAAVTRFRVSEQN